MNILGMGTTEILVVLLLAFILLGPGKMVDAARLLGKASREVRRMTEELPRLTLDEVDERPEGRPRSAGPSGAAPANTVAAAESNGRPESPGAAPADDGPVQFKPSGPAGPGQESADDKPAGDGGP